MKNKKFILFDMDGTTNDSILGITNGIEHALNLYGIKVDKASLTKYIGPPFRETLTKSFGFSPEKAKEVHLEMAKYMTSTGVYQNKLYGGILDLLKELKGIGKTLAFATLKGIDQARIVINHFGLSPYFSVVGATDYTKNLDTKSGIIKYVLDILKVTDKSQVVMVGDRHGDISAARENGIESVGVLYGYGTREELENENPTHIVQTVEELRELLI